MASSRPSATEAVFPLVDPSASQVAGLVTVLRRLSVARSTAEIMDVAVHAARTLLSADGATFVLREGDLCHYADEDAIAPLWKDRRFPMAACISGWCMEHGRPVAIPDIYEDSRIPHDVYRPTFVRSLVMAPVRQEDPIAALGAYWSKVRRPSAAEIDMLQTIANAAALSVACIELRLERAHKPSPAQPLALRAPKFLGQSLSAHPMAASHRIAIGLGFALAAWALRALASPLLGPQLPYATFAASVLLAAFWRGRLAGFTAALAGGLAANLSFVGLPRDLELQGYPLIGLLVFWGVASGGVLIADAMRSALLRQAAENSRLEVVGRELRHRIRNMMNLAQALAHQTGRNATDVQDFERKFMQRFEALADAQMLLAESDEGAAKLSVLVERALLPFEVGDRLRVDGGVDVELDQQLAVGLALILNELATNAVKYGALSPAGGRVEVGWTSRNGELRIVWVERDGPPVRAPEATGYGTRLLRTALPQGRADVRVSYEPTGLRCEIEFARL